MGNKKVKNLVIFFIAAIILVIIATVTKPASSYEKEVNKESAKKTEIDKMGDLSKLKPLETKEKKVVHAKDPEKGAKTEEAPKDDKTRLKEANGKVADYLNQHKGKGVHAIDKVDASESNPSRYPVVEADFTKVKKLNYRSLKKVYTYFRLKDAFPEVVLKKLNGAAVELTGAVMPVDKIPEDGVFHSFWLSNPVIVLAGCVFCNPPTMADIIYVEKKSGEVPFSVEREKLFKQVVLVKVVGRLHFGPESTGDQTYLFSIEAETIEELN